ncbi:hypothetical protein FC093_06865 [Ilyomonas limi]|uniref:Uncharacterized protein n=1 Tax=Ilyomonas limi TaxID=2575867 RepID=A0A4U3L3Y6_9BACT|nr:hypothetical protein [Ilyomonas limi]TKK69795.1 hypothetical protein FC093_06865 [Ilyomonas limi]
MDYSFRQTLLSRSLLSGLLAGLVAVAINVVYDYVFREITSYSLSEVVNVAFIIFSSLLVELAAGICYYLFSKMNRGKLIYMAFFLALIVLGILGAFQTERSNNITNQHEFRYLFSGIMLIDGLVAAFLIPYFVNHDKIYS